MFESMIIHIRNSSAADDDNVNNYKNYEFNKIFNVISVEVYAFITYTY